MNCFSPSSMMMINVNSFTCNGIAGHCPACINYQQAINSYFFEMMYERYLQQKLEIEAKTAGYTPVSNLAAYRKFALFTTNLGLALPELPLAEHLPLFAKAVTNRQLSFLDAEYSAVAPWQWVHGRALNFESLKKQPAVIGTFHVGSYRLVNHLLVRNGVRIALLVSSTVRERQGEAFLSGSRLVGNENPCTLITADHPMAGLHILRAIKNNRTVVGYLDGNRGAAGPQHMHVLPFLNVHIHARIGLAHLARRAGVPLYGVMSKRNVDGRIAIWKNRSIYTNRDERAHISPEVATEMLYSDLAALVEQKPWQWDQWYYLHECFLGNAMG